MTGTLVVVAVAEEAAYLEGIDHLVTGIGKVAAAVSVTAAVQRLRPERVLGVGTAGALRDGLVGLHRIGTVIEHDLDHPGIAALLGRPVPAAVELDPSSPIVLATGDLFVADPARRQALAERAHLVDMEGYAVARACAAAGVPCELLKVVSDDASDDAGRTWRESVDAAARVLAEAVAVALR